MAEKFRKNIFDVSIYETFTNNIFDVKKKDIFENIVNLCIDNVRDPCFETSFKILSSLQKIGLTFQLIEIEQKLFIPKL